MRSEPLPPKHSRWKARLQRACDAPGEIVLVYQGVSLGWGAQTPGMVKKVADSVITAVRPRGDFDIITIEGSRRVWARYNGDSADRVSRHHLYP
jgi:hypothetical protein